jgi:hypothetical protein
MILNKDSWHYKLWASTFDSYERPSNTDLCRYCHRIFWRLVSYVVVAFGLAFVLGCCFYIIYKGFICHPVISLITIGFSGLTVTAICRYNRWLTRDRNHSEPQTLIGQWAHAAKQGVCPMVEFSSSSEEK